MKKLKRTKRSGSTAFVGTVTKQSLGEFGTKAMGIYADEVNLSRAVPDLIDGLKPVQRRIMWGAHQMPNEMVKTARLCGHVIGRFHPHSDQGVSGAIETIMHTNVPTMRGQGEWGSLIDSAAAMRYTQCRLSDYGHTFFDSNYIAKEVTMFVPNYDDTTVEPVCLPALMPNVLMNGGEGIGVRTTTMLPTFTPESLVEVMTRLLKGEKLKAKDFADTLVYNYRYGGRVVKSKANRVAWGEMFTGPKARVQFEAILKIDKDDKAIEIETWPEGLNPVKFIEKVRQFAEVDQAYNHRGATGFRIEMRKDHNYAQFDKLVAKVQKASTVNRSFRINVTHRQASINDGIVDYDTKYLALSVPELLIAWLKERIALEKRSLAYRIVKQKEAIAYSKLMIWVAKNADAVIKVIRGSMDPLKDLMKKFKLEQHQAQSILDLPLKKLSKLDQAAISKKLEEQLKHAKELEAWLAKPKAKVLADTKLVFDAIESDRKFEAAKSKKLDVI
jgi:topoisomerase-4 subunit A